MKASLVCGAILTAGLVVSVGWHARGGNEPVGKEAVRIFMRGKLDASRDVTEGLVTENYDLIANGADRMRVMSKKAEWNALKTERYQQYSDEFQRITAQMAKAGREKNLDAAALAWTQVTLICVNCHRYARDTRMSGLEIPSDRNLFAALAAREEK